MATSIRGIRLYVQLQDHYTANVVDGFRFSVVAGDGVLMPNEIFRYTPSADGLSATALVGPQSYGEQAVGAQGYYYVGAPGAQYSLVGTGTFDGVCTLPDLEEFPVWAPLAGGVPPYYRQALIDLVFRSRQEAVDALAAIQEDVARLVRSMNASDELGAPKPVWFGLVPSSNPGDTNFPV